MPQIRQLIPQLATLCDASFENFLRPVRLRHCRLGCRSISRWNNICGITAHNFESFKLLRGLVTTELMNNAFGIKQSSEPQDECYLAREEHDDASGEEPSSMQSLTWCKFMTIEGLSSHGYCIKGAHLRSPGSIRRMWHHVRHTVRRFRRVWRNVQ